MFLKNCKKSVAVSRLPRVGSHSIESACEGWEACGIEGVIDCETSVGWIRNPIDRMRSAYSLYNTIYTKGRNAAKDAPPAEVFFKWETFVDYALAYDDPHWRSQISFLTLNDKYIPTISHRFEDVMHFWPRYSDGRFPWLNRVQRLEINQYRMNDILSFYNKDLALWHSL